MKTHFCTLLVAALALTGCGQDASPGQGGPATTGTGSAAAGGRATAKVVARVNGAPITEVDVEHRVRNDNHEAAPGPDHRKTVLEQLVTKEILAQKAEEKGLDRDPKYQEGLRRLEAQLAAYRRQELSELILRREAEKRSTPTEEDARAHFQKNEKRIRSQVHVLQILRRSEAAIIEARSTVERGKPFEEVAKDLFPGLPEGQKPWDLGYLSFQKVPEPWRETVYDMKPGEMSGILRGPNERFWLVKLVDVRQDEALTFESVKEAVLADMKVNRLQRSREELEKELRAGAKIEVLSPP
jgi:peptidyl-prolyl cis-trans isomerase C